MLYNIKKRIQLQINIIIFVPHNRQLHNLMESFKLMIRKCAIFILLLAQVLGIYAQTEMGMNLGSLSLIRPSASLSHAKRTINVRIATTGISSRVWAKVGGVAFVQTAIPDFDIESLELKCNTEENVAYALINGDYYKIPLEIWQLKPIVEYADDENNAAVTLYGDDGVRIKYHSAFVDELLGLRLLQTDLMLASNMLSVQDRGKFPADENGYIMSNTEREKYDLLNNLYSILYDVDYQTMSLAMSVEIHEIIDSIGEAFDTYIYTDQGENIYFSIADSALTFTGEPYYRFAGRDEVLVDTVEMVAEIKNFVDSFFIRKAKYDRNIICSSFNKEGNEKIYEINRILRTSNEAEVVDDVFDALNYYEASDTLEAYSLGIGITISNMYWEEYVDSILEISSNGKSLEEDLVDEILRKSCSEIRCILDNDAFYSAVLLSDYSTFLNGLYPNDEVLSRIAEIYEVFDITNEQLFIFYLKANRIPTSEEMSETTKCVKNSGAVYNMNPIVFDAADKTCHWSAFFRYVKENFADTWEAFKCDVQELRNDGPIVWTPVDFE